MLERKYKIKNDKLRLNFLLILGIIFSICFLSVGYAAITSTNLNINLLVSTTTYEGMFISDVKYTSDNGAEIEKSEIIDYNGTMLHSDIFLSPTSTSSSITYTVTIFNNSDSNKKFTGISYAEAFYSNQDIMYKIEGMQLNEIIEKGNGKTFDLTFYYNNISTITNNELDSYLNFNFDYYFDQELEVDFKIEPGGSYSFAGVSPENPIDLQNIANITFAIMNGSESVLNDIEVSVTYITTSGSKQSGSIGLYDENDKLLQTQTIQFQGKQENGATIVTTFSNLNLERGTKLTIKFDKTTITNGKVDVTNVTLTPVF